MSKTRVAQKAQPANVLPFTNIRTGIINYKNNDRITIQQTTTSYQEQNKSSGHKYNKLIMRIAHHVQQNVQVGFVESL